MLQHSISVNVFELSITFYVVLLAVI